MLSDPSITAVAIATPAVLHHQIAKAALERSKHVFVEKPLALNLGQAEELVALAERFDRRLMVGHLLQYHPAFLKLKELVRDGALGRLQYIYSNRLNLGEDPTGRGHSVELCTARPVDDPVAGRPRT